MSHVPQFMELRQLRELQRKGVEFVSLDSVFIEETAVIEPGATIHPNVFIYGNSRISHGAVVYENTIIKDSLLQHKAQAGPFAHIYRSTIGTDAEVAHIEIVRSFVALGTKAKHFGYIGDTYIGAGCNIGAGVVFANYNGKEKHRTTVNKDVFIGSNSTIVAPCIIGQSSLIAAGSTVTHNVAANTLVIARGNEEIHKEGYVYKQNGKWNIKKPAQ